MLDYYCERTGPEFWSEPVNALTNSAFIIAGILIFLLIRKEGIRSPQVYILNALMIIIGTGSFLFHTFATPWAAALDVIPIFLFQLAYLSVYAVRIMQLKVFHSVILMCIFILLTSLCGLLPRLLNGSILYAPALFFLSALAIYHLLSNRRSRYILLFACGLFFASLTFRTIDDMLCTIFPQGSHFLWHVLNGAVLYLAMRGLIRNW